MKSNVLVQLSWIRQSKKYNLCFGIVCIAIILSTLMNFMISANHTYSVSVRWVAILYVAFWGIRIPQNTYQEVGAVCPVRNNIKIFLFGDLAFLLLSIMILPIEYLVSSRTGIIGVLDIHDGLMTVISLISQFIGIFVSQVLLNMIYNVKHQR